MPELSPIRVISIDDHSIFRRGVRDLLDEFDDVELVAEGSSGEEIIPLLQTYRPDVLLLDLNLPREPGATTRDPGQRFPILPFLFRIRTVFPETRIIILSQHATSSLARAAGEAGVRGYLVKDDALTTQLVSAIRTVVKNGLYFSEEIETMLRSRRQPTLSLSTRQTEVLLAIAANPDLSREQISEQMGITVHTVDHHLRTIYDKLGVSSLPAALLKAARLGLIPLLRTDIDPGADYDVD